MEGNRFRSLRSLAYLLSPLLCLSRGYVILDFYESIYIFIPTEKTVLRVRSLGRERSGCRASPIVDSYCFVSGLHPPLNQGLVAI